MDNKNDKDCYSLLDELVKANGLVMIPEYTARVVIPSRDVIGRDNEMKSLKAAFMRPELCNVILLGDAGSGKTTLVGGLMMDDLDRAYLEVDLSKMLSRTNNDANELANMLKDLFNEVTSLSSNNFEVVLFIDEFHQIVQLSDAAVEVLKPLLANSGTRGIRVVAATTYEEFDEFIRPNQALVERLQRINLAQPNKDVVVSILEGICRTYDMIDRIEGSNIFSLIYDYTNKYLPSQSQPRKSLKILDSMIGWARLNDSHLTEALLSHVIQESENINVSFKVDAFGIEDFLNSKVFGQEHAVKAVTQRLHICTAGLNNPTKPMASFLFAGSTGVGKTELTKQLALKLFDDDRNLIRFDMSEYPTTDTVNVFRSKLTREVWARPFSIILFDEIEKADPTITRLLLQVLDDGRLSDSNGRQVSFLNTYIVLTTNLGSSIFESISKTDANLHALQGLIRKNIIDSSDSFPAELLGRIDEIVPFQPLGPDLITYIVNSKLDTLSALTYDKHQIVVNYSTSGDKASDKGIITFLVEEKGEKVASEGGARKAVSNVDRYVVGPISQYINAQDKDKMTIRERFIMVYVEGEMYSIGKSKRESDAYVNVRPFTDEEFEYWCIETNNTQLLN